MVCQIPNKDSSIQTFLSLYDSKLHQKIWDKDTYWLLNMASAFNKNSLLYINANLYQ